MSVVIVKKPQEDACPSVLVRPAPAEEVAQRWPFLRARLVEIQEQQQREVGLVTWTPEHVRMQLMTGQAELWLVHWGESGDKEQRRAISAFAITQIIVDPCLNVPHGLFFWFLWRSPDAPARVITDAMDEFFDGVARSRGLLYVQGISPWKHFVERMNDSGWKTVGYIIRKEVPPA